MHIKRLLILLFLSGSLSSFAQESIIKDFAETRNKRKFCLYPSTLRMMSLNDKELHELVNDIDKFLIYQLDSALSVSPDKKKLLEDYSSEGFEEYASVIGADETMYLLGKEDEFVGLAGSKDQYLAFYLRGNIGLHKLPVLMRSLENNQLLTLLAEQFK